MPATSALAVFRSMAMVINKMVYEFGPDLELFKWIGGQSICTAKNTTTGLAK